MSVLDDILAEQDATAWPEQLGDYLSASRLTKFQLCPEQFRRRYIQGETEPMNGPLVWGRADHGAHEVNFRQKIETHEDLPVDDVRQACADIFDVTANESDVVWGDDKPGAMKDAAVNLVAAYHLGVSPTVQPVAVEERFEVRVPGVPVPIIGYIDVPTAVDAIERKTTKAKTVVPQPQWRIQGLLYQLVEHKPVSWHVATKTKTPGLYTPATDPGLQLATSPGREQTTQRFVKELVNLLLAYWATWGPDDPWPGNLTHTWACSRCAFFPTCEWWRN